jgi:hypothetical protein
MTEVANTTEIGRMKGWGNCCHHKREGWGMTEMQTGHERMLVPHLTELGYATMKKITVQ